MLTRHHKQAKSRGGKSDRDNLMIIPFKFHQGYNLLFGDLGPEEAQRFFDIVFFSNKRKWTGRELHELRNNIKTL